MKSFLSFVFKYFAYLLFTFWFVYSLLYAIVLWNMTQDGREPFNWSYFAVFVVPIPLLLVLRSLGAFKRDDLRFKNGFMGLVILGFLGLVIWAFTSLPVTPQPNDKFPAVSSQQTP